MSILKSGDTLLSSSNNGFGNMEYGNKGSPFSPYDLLQSMSECISETQNIFLIPKIPDRVTSTSVHRPRKPPKEVFYRKNLMFVTSRPDKSNEQCYCTCLVKCNMGGKKGRAVKKCLSCALYGTTGESFFCSPCFTYR